jgi:AraC family transcriptional regulator, ethanolamine operon transcriptional activator
MNSKVATDYFSFSNINLHNFNSILKEWKVNFIQLRPGKFSADLAQLISPNFQFGHAKFSRAVKQEGISPEGLWTFAFVNEKNLIWRNYKVNSKSIIIYAPGSEINAVSSANFEVVVFSIPDDFLKEVGKKMNIETFYHSLKTIAVLETKDPLWDVLRENILKELDKHNQNSGYKTDIELIDKLCNSLLLLLQNSNISASEVSSKKRLKLLGKAEDYIIKNLTEPMTVADIASHCDMSERTLLYAFKNRFNMGTKDFMKVLNLNHLYHALHERKNIDSVSTIARGSGFWHMGQLYKDYKKFFGELPSHTLKKSLQK